MHKKKFNIKNLKNIVLLGYIKNYKKLFEINKKLNLNTILITTSDQKKNIKNSKEIFEFNSFSKKFTNFIKKIFC